MKRFSQDISLVLGGAAGQGIQTVEALLVQVLKREGYRVFACKEYMSRIRGGSNSTEIRIGQKRRSAFLKRIDLLFALDKDVVPHLKDRISKETIVLGEKTNLGQVAGHVVNIPFTQFANELGNPIYTSTVAVGVVLGMLGAELGVFEAYLQEHFSRKGEEVVAKNLEAAQKGYLFGKHVAYDTGIEVHIKCDETIKDEVLCDGVTALGLGVLAAGCNYISSYPMSPGTGLLTFLAQQSTSFPIVVDQTEDEIAAINQGLGAWYAGARALVTTSGGGFDLMTEGVSLSGIIETPIVVHIGQRPGPATGLPTRTEQADLNLVLYAGHGEFPRAVFAPGNWEEAFLVGQQAFYIADRYQVPVFILTDQYFLDMIGSFSEENLVRIPIQQHIVKTEADYKRYAVTKDGVSPRGVPGYGNGLVGVDSDEHDESAHITESATVRRIQHEKRLSKLSGIRKEALIPVEIGDVQHADIVVVTWGSNRGILEEVVERMNRDDVAGLHFFQVYPLPTATKKLVSRKKIIVLENNATGQFADLLSREYGVKITERYLQYDGSPFAVEDVLHHLKKFFEE